MDNEESAFRVLLQQFLSYIDTYEKDFYDYFKAHYCNRLEQLASCFRVGTVVNTKLICSSNPSEF